MRTEPISRQIFQKMLFCDQIFQFLELEESLYFTALDVEFHSAKKGQELTEEDLLNINQKHLSAMSVNLKGVKDETDIGGVNPSPYQKEVQAIVEKWVIDNT